MDWITELGQQQSPANAGPRSSIGHIEVEDVCQWEETSRPWELIARQLDGGKLHNRKDYLVTPSVVLYRETLTPAVRVQGLSPACYLTFAILLRSGPRTTYYGVHPDASRLIVAAPGGVDVTVDAEYSHLILLVHMELLQRCLPAQCLARLTRAADRHGLSLAPNKLARFRDWMARILERAFDTPRAFEHAAVIASLEEDVLQWLARICAPSDSNPHAARRRRGLNRALEYLRTADVSRVSVADLCRVARVSDRTLRYAFHDELDLSPLAFLRRLRLHAARRELMNAEGALPRVTDVANRQGFLELGRFAGDYRRLFGELPSETLAHRRAVAPSPLLLD
jgi:AraC family transcriptional regulator, ethanolamine operon transcriptional activator